MKKKLIVGMIVLSFGFIATHQTMAQESLIVSKGIQKVANKKAFNDEEVMKSHITATTVSQDWVVSKGVNNVGKSETAAVDNIRSTRNNDWAISKGVHRVKESKPADEKNGLEETSPAITKGR